jgi:hypothetical protein
MPGTMNGKGKQFAEVFEKRGEERVRVWIGTRFVETSRDRRGRIHFDKPERVSDRMKRDEVPRLYREIDARLYGRPVR